MAGIVQEEEDIISIISIISSSSGRPHHQQLQLQMMTEALYVGSAHVYNAAVTHYSCRLFFLAQTFLSLFC